MDSSLYTNSTRDTLEDVYDEGVLDENSATELQDSQNASDNDESFIPVATDESQPPPSLVYDIPNSFYITGVSMLNQGLTKLRVPLDVEKTCSNILEHKVYYDTYLSKHTPLGKMVTTVMSNPHSAMAGIFFHDMTFNKEALKQCLMKFSNSEQLEEETSQN